MNHSWKYSGPPETALDRTCELCGAGGRRFVGPTRPGPREGRGFLPLTRWETRTADGQPWTAGRIPPCPAGRKSRYTPVHVLLERRLKAEGVIPPDAEVTAEHLPGDWRRRSTPEHPAWLAKWAEDGAVLMVFSCYSMRRCAEAPVLRKQGDQIIPARRNGEP